MCNFHQLCHLQSSYILDRGDALEALVFHAMILIRVREVELQVYETTCGTNSTSAAVPLVLQCFFVKGHFTRAKSRDHESVRASVVDPRKAPSKPKPIF